MKTLSAKPNALLLAGVPDMASNQVLLDRFDIIAAEISDLASDILKCNSSARFLITKLYTMLYLTCDFDSYAANF